MRQEGCLCKGRLEGLEGCGCFRSPEETFGFTFEQVGEWSGDAVTSYETSVKVGETKESLEFFDRGGFWPGGYSCDLPLIHADPLAVNEVS